MNRKKLFFGLWILVAALLAASASAGTYTVGESGQALTTIQGANDSSWVMDGDTIILVDAVHTEDSIILSKDLVIMGLAESFILQADPDSGMATNRIMYINPDTRVELYNLTIQHGVEEVGGAIFNEGELIMGNCLVRKNVATSLEPDGGGGIYNLFRLAVMHSDFTLNYTDGHGAGINNSSEEAVMAVDGCNFYNNFAGVGGGGIGSPFDDSILVVNSTFTDNFANGGKGGGLLIGGGSTEDLVHVANCTFTGNTSGVGGALTVYADSAMLENLVIIGNTSVSGAGAGISIVGGAIMITNCTVTGNTAGNKGGGISISHRSECYIHNTTISDNYTYGEGGGILTRGNIAFDFVTLTNNTSEGVGGGLAYVQPETTPDHGIYIMNSVIAGNFDSTRTHPNIFDDSCKVFSGGYNLINILGNYEFRNNATGDIYGDTANTTVANGGATKLNEVIDPMLGDLEGEWHKFRVPQIGSPLLDAASSLNVLGQPVVIDQIGNSRPVNQGCDIGAIERQIIDVDATVSGVSASGFTVTLSQPVDGLDDSNFILDNDGNVTSATTSDAGMTYSVTTDELTEGITYTLDIADEWCIFTVGGDDIYIEPTVEGLPGSTVNKLAVYPNPATGTLYINMPDVNIQGTAAISILDISGRQVKMYNMPANGQLILDISDITPGIYSIKISAVDMLYTGRLIIR
jgi:parallel beta-helix repeat protein